MTIPRRPLALALLGFAFQLTAFAQQPPDNGVPASSERFKTDVRTMGAASEKLMKLRPVTFKLKSDPSARTQYGLIAEEVAQVYPELVIRGADGRIDGVRYEELAPMLLNMVQQLQSQLAIQVRLNAEQAHRNSDQAWEVAFQARQIDTQVKRIDAQTAQIEALSSQVTQLNEFKRTLLGTLEATHAAQRLVTQRSGQ